MKLNVNDIFKKFGEKDVLKGASFTFEKGKIYGLLGRNGAGKTTLFNCISGDLRYENGSVSITDEYGTDVTESREIGFAFSTPVLPEFLTGYEFIKFYMEIHNIDEGKTPADYLRQLHFTEEDMNKLIKGYSQGMKNKLQMLTFFISHPAVILLDEPMTSLDVVVAHEMKEILLSMKDEHITILSTHIMQLAADLCDEIVLLHDGKLQGLVTEGRTDRELEAYVMDLLKEDYREE